MNENRTGTEKPAGTARIAAGARPGKNGHDSERFVDKVMRRHLDQPIHRCVVIATA